MAVYSKKMNKHQRSAIQEFENISGFEFMYQEDFDDGKITFKNAWNKNIKWLNNMISDVENINISKAIENE